MTISLRVKEIDGVLIKRFAAHNNMTVSSFIRNVVIDHIGQEYDKLVEEYENNNKFKNRGV